MMFGKGFKKTAIISIIIAVSSVIVGIVVSYTANLAPGGIIVLISIFILLGSIGIRSITKKTKSDKDNMTSLTEAA
jgi:zinc transport system permease protein